MKAGPAQLVRRLAELAPLPTSDPAPDAVLLERFIGQRDEAAFTVLVARHGPMVLRLCRRVLGNAHDADDAFQATFLVLARKAGAIRRRHHLAAWLHGTAYRLALKSRVACAQRHRGEITTPVTEPADPHPDPLTRMTARELLAALDEELTRLPEVYRLPLVLCCLEGRTQEEAAQQLGWTPGSVKGRLERGRARLHARLARRGMDLSAGLLALEALHGAAGAVVPRGLLTSTTQAAFAFVAGVRNAGANAGQAVALAEGALRAMMLKNLKIVSAALVLATVLSAGGGMLVFRTPAHAGTDGTPSKAPALPAPQAAKPGEKKVNTDMEKLQGEWVAVASGQDGRAIPPSQVKQWNLKLTIEGNRYTWQREGDKNYLMGTFALNPAEKPKWIDLAQISVRPGARREEFGPVPVTGIYEVGDKTLKISLGAPRDQRPGDFTTQPRSNRTLYVFRRSAERPEKQCFSTRKGNTITLHPENATFRVSDIMLNWFAGFKNNLHLSRADLAKVENGAGDWDTEYALVCNAVLPFARCYAHVGDEGWGKEAVGFADLQVRVYVLKKTLDQVKRLIEERGEAKVKEITKKPPTVTTGEAAGWKRWSLAYERWYGDYGGTANVDFRARQFDGQTVVFVFMYTELKRFPQEAKIREMLESFSWPVKGNLKPGAEAAPAQPAFPSEKDSTAKLLKDLDRDDPYVRGAAIDLLAKRKAMSAVPRLIELLSDGRALVGSDNWVGGHTANALQAITGQPFYEDQNAWRRWWARRQANQ